MLTTRNIFIANLAISDILLCSFTMPLTLVDLLTKVDNDGVLYLIDDILSHLSHLYVNFNFALNFSNIILRNNLLLSNFIRRVSEF